MDVVTLKMGAHSRKKRKGRKGTKKLRVRKNTHSPIVPLPLQTCRRGGGKRRKGEGKKKRRSNEHRRQIRRGFSDGKRDCGQYSQLNISSQDKKRTTPKKRSCSSGDI